MNYFAILSKFKYVFLAILTVTILVSQYGLSMLTHVFAVALPHITTCNNTNTATVTAANNTSVLPNKQFLVLLWTPYFNHYESWPKMEDIGCSSNYRNCKLTHDRRLLNVSDALLFHWTRLDIKHNDLPTCHDPRQVWIVLNQESPNYSPLNTILPLVNQINWTMTYRRDSNIYAPYGQIVKCDNSGRKVNNAYNTKTKSVAWIVSKCVAHSKREQYVRELQRYIDVDIYGDCGEYCAQEPSCLESIARDYKFYLSFENSICNDYVTEKLFNAAKYDIIPVVRGGANYSAIMPHNSYIDAFNFSSPKQLAQYLHVVGSDPIKYNSYMSWKQNYCSVNIGWKMFCNLCDALNKLTNYTSKNTNLIDWWFRGGNCSVNAHL